MAERLLRLEAMLAELLRRQTPPEGVEALQRRLTDYVDNVHDDASFARWLIGPIELEETR